jgi:ABC-type molybdate transport system substrate-binding protein
MRGEGAVRESVRRAIFSQVPGRAAKSLRRAGLAVTLSAAAWAATAADLAVLSDAALRPALNGLLANWSHETGHRVSVSYGAAEELRRKLATGERADLVLMPRAEFDDAQRQGIFHPTMRREFALGRVPTPASAYSAGVRSGSPSAGVAAMLLEHLAGPEGRAAFAAP